METTWAPLRAAAVVMEGAAGAIAWAAAAAAYATVSVTRQIALISWIPSRRTGFRRNSTGFGGRKALPLSQQGADSVARLRGRGRERRLAGHAGEHGFEEIVVIFKERELDGVGKVLLPDDAVLLHGVEPALKAGECEILACDDAEESDGEAILLTVGVDAGGAAEALLDAGEEGRLIGWSESRIAGQVGEEIGGVRRGVNPALDRIEAAVVALIAQIGEGTGEQCAVLAG